MLSEIAVRQAKPKDRDYKLSDAEGLHLFVAMSGHRSWRLSDGRFPKSRAVGSRCTVWVEAEIDEWLNSIVAGGRI